MMGEDKIQQTMISGLGDGREGLREPTNSVIDDVT